MSGNNQLNIGLIGTDSSHATAFTALLNEKGHEFHVQGGQVTTAYAGGSRDFELSISRVGKFAAELAGRYKVEFWDTPEQVAENSDAILLLAADGRKHRELFERIAAYGKPVFIDKPLALSLKEAEKIRQIARENNTMIMSSSSLRYAEALTRELERGEAGAVTGADCYGPMVMEPTQKGYFWYGIHSVEMLYTLMGTGCQYVTAMTTDAPGAEEIIIGEWDGGRVGTARGSRVTGTPFAAVVHREKRHAFVDIDSSPKPFYASLLEQVMRVFKGEAQPLDMSITLEIIRFIEAANESRENGRRIKLF
ncbi:Gfo/Idh/MocA family oxidoreductase [Paenibacillus sp.]|jgi:predicted dehydrogenase|uniref:Gfo/Idh/MocA family protein n=1 Tax=Paenibacillus sp. TaxID=58172 RepID=UPI00282500D0|nr:Gfo/Idh/MocA family oxidoreductase [Paenibacillus sp.]MDR0269110.1 Gfo/Idh/MocA family oxidoreductase [Paenibacillus sp.]